MALSIDKVIPEKGYVNSNVVLCTARANTVKHNLNLAEMKAWLPDWYCRIVRQFPDLRTN